MKYSEARPLIQTGDVLAWRGDTFWSRLIRRATLESYSHVGIARVDGGRVMVLEAVDGGGVRYVPLSHRLPCNVIHTGRGLGEWQLAIAMENLGKEYSRINAVLAWLGLPLRDAGYQCSQYVKEVLGMSCEPLPGSVVDEALGQGGTMRLVEG